MFDLSCALANEAKKSIVGKIQELAIPINERQIKHCNRFHLFGAIVNMCYALCQFKKVNESLLLELMLMHLWYERKSLKFPKSRTNHKYHQTYKKRDAFFTYFSFQIDFLIY